MARLVVFVVCVCAVLGGVAAQLSEESLDRSIFPSRTGRAVLVPKSAESFEPDTWVGVLDPSGKFVDASGKTSSVDLDEISDVVTRTAGVTPVSSRARAPKSLRADAPMSAPRANMLVSAIGFGADSMMEQLPRTSELFGSAALSARVTGHTFPRTALSTLSSLSTGQPISKHGIPAPEWRDENGAVVAFSEPLSRSSLVAPNVADSFVSSFHGESLIVSASASSSAARAFSAHDADASLVITFEESADGQRRFVSMDEQQRFVMTDEDLLQSIQDSTSGLWEGVSVEMEARTLTVNVNGESVSLAFNQPAVFRLLGELELAASLSDRLSASEAFAARVHDSTPDLFAVTISSYEAAVRSMSKSAVAGAAGKRAAAFSMLVDRALTLAAQSVSRVYGSDHLTEVVLLGSRNMPASLPAFGTPAMQSAASVLASKYTDLVADASMLPYVRVNADVTPIQAAAKLRSEEFELFVRPVALPAMAELQTRADPPQGGNAAVKAVSHDRVSKFQIVLWLSIILVFVLLAAVYSMAYMDNAKDTLLYSKFNPNWAQRKNQ